MAIIILKSYGNIKYDPIGPELSLLTCGYFEDTLIKILAHKPYWPSFANPGYETGRIFYMLE